MNPVPSPTSPTAAAPQAGAQSFKPANGWVSDAALMLDAKEWQKGTERTRAALARKRADGVTLGRPPGATSIDTKLDPEIENIRKMTQAGVSVASLARMFNVSRKALTDYLMRKNLKPSTVFPV